MNLPPHTHVFFIGIGGAGMSALAGLLHGQGIRVAGYDRSPGLMTHKLMGLGIQVIFDDSVDCIPAEWNTSNTLVVYTPAIPSNSILLNHFTHSGNQVMKRAQLMGDLLQSTQVLAVAGTHDGSPPPTSSMSTSSTRSPRPPSSPWSSSAARASSS